MLKGARPRSAELAVQEWGENERMGQREPRDLCLVEHVLKKRELIGLLLSRVGQEARPQAGGCR